MSELFKRFEAAPRGARQPLDGVLDALKFNGDGLLPAIAQQYDTHQVLMLAWMDRRAIQETLNTGQVCYWSRSRQSYWRKGESSGHVQRLVEMRFDCDGDTVLLLVDQQGPACHTHRADCFYHRVVGGEVEVLSDPVA